MVKKVLTVCLCAWLVMALPARAEDYGQSSDQSGIQSNQPSSDSWSSSSAQTNGMTDGQRMTAGQSQTVQLDPLIGQKVMDSQQKEVGQIQDIVLDAQGHKAKYAILGSGGFLGVGSDYHAVPWSALQIQSTGEAIRSITLSTDAETIRNSPKIEMGTTRSFDSRLQSQVDSYYQGKGLSNGTFDMPSSNGIGSSSSVDQYPSNGSTGVRPQGMTGTSNQNTQFNTAEPQTESIYGDGVRSGQDQSLGTELNETSQTTPFGSYTDGTSGDADQTATVYRKGYAEGIDRPTQSSRDVSQNGMANGQSVQTTDSQFVWFSDLSGREVRGSADEKIGSIEDVVADAKQGNLLFGLVSMDDGMVAIPWNSLQSTGQDTYTVNIEKDSLRTLAFRSDNRPDFNDPSYQQRVYSQFGQQPPSVYGYVSPEGGAAGIDPMEMELSNQFDSQRIETISGEIKEMKKDRADETMTHGQQKSMCFKVESEQGQTVTVYGAPKQFLKDRGLELSEGDNVRITGSRAQIKGEDALIATKISKDTKEVMIRSSQGQPMWQSSGQTGSQMRSGTSGRGTQSNGATQSNGTSQSKIDTALGGSAAGQSSGSSMGNGSSYDSSGQSTIDKSLRDPSYGNGTMADSQSLQFSAAEQTDISGTIQSTDTGSMPVTMDEAVLFKVQTDQGETKTVYAGPRSYLEQKNMSFTTGDTVKATGWKKTIGGQEVFIASEIEKDGQTLQLRDSSGHPQWKSQDSGSRSLQQQSGQTSGSNGSNMTTY